jgi:hypothetical protein
VPTGKFVAGSKLGVAQLEPQALSRIDTLSDPWLATARSGMPSPLKSATATEAGVVPTPKFVAMPKVPVPLPNRIDTVAELPFATARSTMVSPLKSPTATERGLAPTLKFVAGPKLAVSQPSALATPEATKINPAASTPLAARNPVRRL